MLTFVFAFRSLRIPILLAGLGPIAVLDGYLSLHSRLPSPWLAVFAATAIVAALSVLLSGRIYDRRHPDQG
jgi:hypothetical protein